MKLSNSLYFLKQAGLGVWRNGWMSFASIVVVVLTLLILGAFTIINLNIHAITEEIKNQVEIIAYLDEDAESAEEVERLRAELLQLSGVHQVKYISKDEALERLRERLGDRSGITDGLERNPLQDSFEIRPQNVEQTQELAAKISRMSGIDSVDYGEEVVDQLFAFTKAIQTFSYVVIGSLGMISLFLIANTIKLTVYSRRHQINIMKFVGATDWFIRWPYIFEGISLGLIGAMITYLVLFYGYGILYLQVSTWMYQNFLSVQMVLPEQVGIELLKLLFGLGVGIGAIGSGISVRKFLKV